LYLKVSSRSICFLSKSCRGGPHSLKHSELEHEMMLASKEIPSPDAPVTFGLSKSELIELHSAAHRFANATDGWEEVGIVLSPDELVQALVEGPRKHGVAAIHPFREDYIP